MDRAEGMFPHDPTEMHSLPACPVTEGRLSSQHDPTYTALFDLSCAFLPSVGFCK